MTTPHVTDAVLHVIKGAGYSLGETTTIHADGTTRHVINAVDARSRESFTVAAGTLYEAAVELAVRRAHKPPPPVVQSDAMPKL